MCTNDQMDVEIVQIILKCIKMTEEYKILNYLLNRTTNSSTSYLKCQWFTVNYYQLITVSGYCILFLFTAKSVDIFYCPEMHHTQT